MTSGYKEVAKASLGFTVWKKQLTIGEPAFCGCPSLCTRRVGGGGQVRYANLCFDILGLTCPPSLQLNLNISKPYTVPTPKLGTKP